MHEKFNHFVIDSCRNPGNILIHYHRLADAAAEKVNAGDLEGAARCLFNAMEWRPEAHWLGSNEPETYQARLKEADATFLRAKAAVLQALKQPEVKTKPGDRFAVEVADGSVVMEARSLRTGDVWDCYPVEDPAGYGSHMVFTDDEVQRQVAAYKRYW